MCFKLSRLTRLTRMRLPGAATLILLIALTSGCSERVRVATPPNAPVAGLQRLAVLVFNNVSSDPGVGVEFADEVIRVIRESGVYEVLDRAATAAILAKNHITVTEADDPETAVLIGELLQVDAIITGEITHYLEDVSIDTPYRIGSTAEGKTPTWYSGLSTSVAITAKARVIETRTGTTIWSKRVSERDVMGTMMEIKWEFDAPPPTSALPKPSKADIPITRAGAIEKVVHAFTVDILPGYRYEWKKAEPASAG